jgi:hypothetical protein
MYVANIRRWVRRILDANKVGTKEQIRVFPGFVSFDKEPRPCWWHDGIAPPAWGEVLGVHENEPGNRVGSIVITQNGLALLGAGDVPTWVSYGEIARLDKLYKEPVSMSLHVWTNAGEHVELPFHAKVGCAFAFVQFLSGARREHQRAARPE